jgi:aminoglycoside phosphotransferase (APT) family kinase protein
MTRSGAGESSEVPPGIDLGRLADWFATAVPTGGRLLSARLIAGGKSNLTYELSSGAGTWVLRRPPLGHVLATAHDMAREYRVMSALVPTGVPVPVTYALCRDDTVLGVPFYVMQKVTGIPYRTAAELAPLGVDRVRGISGRLVDTLAVLHQVDPVSVGLGDFGRPQGFLERQIRRWTTQLLASSSRPLPAADEVRNLLAANIPPDSAAAIVHGDYRLDNVLIDDQDHPAAIIDWEMATLGDPLTDLALMVVYQQTSRLPGRGVLSDVGLAPGFLAESEIVERYARQAGRDLDRFTFYIGLACYKLAAIVEGIHYRHLGGKTVGHGFDQIGELTEPLLTAGLIALKEIH